MTDVDATFDPRDSRARLGPRHLPQRAACRSQPASWSTGSSARPRARGALVISGANGIVGAGKTMQLGSRLEPFGVPIVALDFPGAPDGIGAQYPGLVRAFGARSGRRDHGQRHPPHLRRQPPAAAARRALSRASCSRRSPRSSSIKKAHYEIFRAAFPEIEIRSVTSGFPQSELGVGIAHPAFPHEINKVWEIVEPEPSDDHPAAVGPRPDPDAGRATTGRSSSTCCSAASPWPRPATTEATNMPFWKVDKFVRRLARAEPVPRPRRHRRPRRQLPHLVLPAPPGAAVRRPLRTLGGPRGAQGQRRRTGTRPTTSGPWSNWTPETPRRRARDLDPRPAVPDDQPDAAREALAPGADERHRRALRPVPPRRAGGDPRPRRRRGRRDRRGLPHGCIPRPPRSAWHPEAFAGVETPEWQQLYVNAEHDGTVGRHHHRPRELQRRRRRRAQPGHRLAQGEGIERVIVTGDFHLATQMVGADTSEFFPA